MLQAPGHLGLVHTAREGRGEEGEGSSQQLAAPRVSSHGSRAAQEEAARTRPDTLAGSQTPWQILAEATPASPGRADSTQAGTSSDQPCGRCFVCGTASHNVCCQRESIDNTAQCLCAAPPASRLGPAPRLLPVCVPVCVCVCVPVCVSVCVLVCVPVCVPVCPPGTLIMPQCGSA